MGTTALIKFWEHDEIIASVYHQHAGNPGKQQRLADFLAKIYVMDGVIGLPELFEAANGVGCLAAQYLAFEKDCVGRVYLCDSNQDADYIYHIYTEESVHEEEDTESIMLIVFNAEGKCLFEGDPGEYRGNLIEEGIVE